MESDSAFIRADGIIELYAVAYIVLDFTIVIDPCNTERENAIRFNHALDYLVACKFRMAVIYLSYR